jgi:atypical dual specificity phosphatase
MNTDKFIWWLEPKRIAGMMMPWLDPMRRFNRTGELHDYVDELPDLYCKDIRSIVCLLNLESDKAIYENCGFKFLCSPIKDFGAPTIEQTLEICRFIDESPQAVAVHCEGGMGRTGTILAAWLITKGDDPDSAIAKVRKAEPGAIESNAQLNFLFRFHKAISSN